MQNNKKIFKKTGNDVIKMYDVIILGGGPAGYSAAIYAVRYNLKSVVIAKEPGGVMNDASMVENYPGFWGITGFDLMNKIKEHVEHLGGEIKSETITSVSRKKDVFVVKTDKSKYDGRSIIISVGAKRRKLNVKGENEFEKRGVSYCYTCDGAFYKGKNMIVAGGGDSSAQAVILLNKFNNKIIWMYRSKLRAEPRYVEQISEMKNVEVMKGEIQEIIGDSKVRKVVLKNGNKLDADGIFVEIGSEPDLSLFRDFNLETEEGYIKVDRNMRTNVKGIYAAGDITNSVFRQAVVAASGGSIAAHSCYKDLFT